MMVPKHRYANAEKVLPRELFLELQKHFIGLLWVASPTSFHKDRRSLVIALHKQNIPVEEIAQLANITIRRVYQICAQNRRQTENTSGK